MGSEHNSESQVIHKLGSHVGRKALSVAQELGCSLLFINSRVLGFSHSHMKKEGITLSGCTRTLSVCTDTCGCVPGLKMIHTQSWSRFSQICGAFVVRLV